MDSESLVEDLRKMRAGRMSACLLVVLSLLALVPSLAGHVAWSIWLFAAVAYFMAVFLLWRQWLGFDSMRDIILQQRESFDSNKEGLTRRMNESERLLAQAKRESAERARQSEQQTAEFAAALEEERKRGAAHFAAYEEIQQALAQLNRENDSLASQEAEAVSRRQSLQKQYSELEKTANEMKAAYTEKADSQRRTLTELERLKSNIKETLAQRGNAETEALRLKRQLETLGMEQSNALLRETNSRNEAAEWKARAEAAEQESRNLKANTALQEELASRRNEIESLYQKIEELTRQRDLATEHGRLLEREREDLAAQLPPLHRQLESLQEVIGELQDECRNAHLEPRHEMARHFVWKINFFKEQEVVLNFLNDGPEVDLVAVRSEPDLACEIAGKSRLGMGAEGRVRVSAPRRLPEEFILKVRYTIYPQETVLRLRPFDSSKLERI